MLHAIGIFIVAFTVTVWMCQVESAIKEKDRR